MAKRQFFEDEASEVAVEVAVKNCRCKRLFLINV